MTEYKQLKHEIITIGGGVKLQLTEFVYTAAEKGKKIYIQSGLHGGETSQWVLYKLHDFLMNNLPCGEVHIIAYANPLAWLQRNYYSTAGKFSLIDGKDFNRCFNDGAAEDINSLICAKLAEQASQCDFVLDLHTSKMSMPFCIYTKPEYENYVKILGLTYNQFSDDASIPALHGTFNACMDRKNIPNITIECGGHDEYHAGKIEQVYNALVKLLNHFTGKTATETNKLYRFQSRKKIYAPTAGLVNYLKTAGEIVNQGDILAELYPTDDLSTVHNITATENGVLLTLNSSHILWQGDMVAEFIPQADIQQI